MSEENKGVEPKIDKNSPKPPTPVRSSLLRFLLTFLFFFFAIQLFIPFTTNLAQSNIDSTQYSEQCEQEFSEVLNAINETQLVSYSTSNLKIFGEEESSDGYIKLDMPNDCRIDYFYGETEYNGPAAETRLQENGWEIKEKGSLLRAEKTIEEKNWIVEKSNSQNPSSNDYSFKLYHE